MSAPTVIKTDKQLRLYQREIEELIARDPSESSDEGKRLELLSLLVETYEKQRFPFEAPDAISAIEFRMEEQGLKQADLVPYFGSRSRVSEVLARKRSLTTTMIRNISAGLGIPADVLLSPTAESDNGQSVEGDLHWEKFPAREMQALGYFSDRKGAESLAEMTKRFFEPLLHIGVPLLARTSMRGDAVTDKSKYGLVAWKAKVLKEARVIQAKRDMAAFKLENLNPEFLKNLAQLSPYENGPSLAVSRLNEIGIVVVVEKHLSGTYLDGAAMLDTTGAPVIGLTLRFDRIDYFWFTLFHELAHVEKHLSNPGDAFLDRVEDKDSEEDLEKEANRIARDTLIPRMTLKRSELLQYPTKEGIRKLADKLNIHQAIVAGRIRRETGNYAVFNDLLGHGMLRKQFA